MVASLSWRGESQFVGLGQLSFSLSVHQDITGFGTTLSPTDISVSEFAIFTLGRRYAIDILGNLMSSCLVGNIFLLVIFPLLASPYKKMVL